MYYIKRQFKNYKLSIEREMQDIVIGSLLYLDILVLLYDMVI